MSANFRQALLRRSHADEARELEERYAGYVETCRLRCVEPLSLWEWLQRETRQLRRAVSWT